MLFTEPMPYAAAVEAAQRRAPVGSVLTSAEWEQMPLALRDRAFWSAQQTNLQFISGAKKGIDGLIAGKTDRATQRLGLRKLAESLGLAPAGGDGSGGVSDLGSAARLGLILDMGLRDAQGQGYYRAGQSQTALDMFPAWELFDTNPGQQTKGRRNWAARWIAAGGPPFFDARMIALKTDRVWVELSRFDQPWPPFDHGSYWDVRAVDYDTAVAARLLRAGETIEPSLKDWNATLEASLPDGASNYGKLLQDTFGDDLTVGENGKVIWQGDRLAELYAKAKRTSKFTDRDVHRVGQATGDTVATVRRDLGIDLGGWQMEVRASELRHAEGGHGTPGNIPGKPGETRADQQPITEADVRAIPAVWRQPDRAQWGRQPARLADKAPADWEQPTLQLISDINGDLYVGEYVADAANKVLRLGSMWKKKP